VRILFIGGTRSVGLAAVRQLASAGHALAVFHRGEHDAELPRGVTRFRSPAAAAMPVRAIPDDLRRFEPDIVVHMIAMGEDDMAAAMRAFAGIARRIVVPSSGDVYRAFGILRGTEPGEPDPAPLNEDSPVRANLFPYREPDTEPESLAYSYDKILVERVAMSEPLLPATILRFPKIYGPDDNQNLATVYGFRHQPHWRWTHGHSANVAAAVALATLDDRASGRIYNVGEAHTPTMKERLARLPARDDVPISPLDANFDQPIVYDTSRIRGELGYCEPVDEAEAMRALALGS
jgi:nucleoside-diphosphate-sugar epimerase